MNLTFEYILDAGAGLFPQVIHTSDNLLRFIYLTADGTVAGSIADPVLGLYGNLKYESLGRISPDETVSHPSIKKVAHYGAYGFWSAEGDHRFVMYMLPTDITNSFVDGSIKYGVGSEVSQMSCSLLNIKGEMLNRYRALVTPGTKMELYFSLGDSSEIALGIFYIDRASVSYPDEKVSVSARNAIGKLLKEQTFNEDNTFEKTTLQLNLKEILSLAEVEDFFVGENAKPWKLRFEPDVTILDGINRVISLLDGWKVDETASGVIGVAAATDARFDQPAVYTFERDKTCWSYSVEYDDSEAVSRVCVTCAEPENTVYADVPRSKWWVQPSHRTTYVTAAEGATLAEITAMAQELAQAIAISGRQESFVGIFTPQLTIGDEVRLVNGAKVETIGTVVDVAHSFGRGGFYTAFTVDSGGRKGKARLSDLIGKVSDKPNLNGVTIYYGRKNNMKDIWNWIQTAFAVIGGGLVWYLGGLDGFLYALIAFVVVDYITGVLRAIVEKKLSSRIGAHGIAKKVAIFLVVGIGHLIDTYLINGTGAPLRTAIIFFYIANEGVSLLENATAIGLPVPEKLKDVLQQLHGKDGTPK